MNREIFYTFDMDWASDEVLLDFENLIRTYNVKATIHVTHKTIVLEKFRNDDRIDCGIHPNYNSLLLGNETKTIEDVLNNIKEIVPEAVCLRSHALTMSSVIAQKYSELGILYELNTFIPVKEGMYFVKCFSLKSEKEFPVFVRWISPFSEGL